MTQSRWASPWIGRGLAQYLVSQGERVYEIVSEAAKERIDRRQDRRLAGVVLPDQDVELADLLNTEIPNAAEVLSSGSGSPLAGRTKMRGW